MQPPDFEAMRREYDDEPLDRRDLPPEPLSLFTAWLQAAAAAGVPEPNGMALATCGKGNEPACRIVLCKQADARGFLWFTNKDSDKGRELAANPQAAATYWWSQPRNRQVRIVGRVEPASDDVADRYFAARPRAARLASAASPQSRPLRDRDQLEAMVAALAASSGDGPVPRPAHWGGYLLVPRAVEFWQGRVARLHDRWRYDRDGHAWRITRLAP
ncbi:MAG TPA: pyridoxamine 5'-phosphate oxidase [Planctomycetota bacterium]|nr:pyridoxamine 5'-phosphate oxidase [Planctomycetota bacterium]